MKSLASDPNDRYRTALEFGIALIEGSEGLDTNRLREMLG
jgi:hypothetical protein